MSPTLRHRLELILFLGLLGVGVAWLHGWFGHPPEEPVRALWKTLVMDILLAAGIFITIKLVAKLPTIFELIGYLLDEGLWYLVPEVFILLAVGALLAIAAAYPVVSPFIYTLF